MSTPADLDGLIESLSGTSSRPAGTTAAEGEHLFTTERMVVSPGAGVFRPGEACREGAAIEVGSELGTVGAQQVLSSFAGQIMGVLALDGERVGPRQPIAWLRIDLRIEP